MHHGQWGVLCHYLADMASNTAAIDLTAAQWNAQIDAFDVNGLAAQLAAIVGPTYLWDSF